jgi:5,10-methenyltetrahydromethanopterin hydrogenase
MAQCAKCGRSLGDSPVCHYCGFVGESKSVVGKGVKSFRNATGKALETGVRVSERVAKEARPVVKAVVDDTKKGVKKAKEETLKAAKSLQR